MKEKFIRLSGIYCFADNLTLCRKLLEGGAKIIQLRDKKTDDRSFARLAADMLAMTKAYDAILIINDRVDIAIGIGADGIHVGQEDEQYREVIRRVPENMIVGVSVDTVGQAVDAQKPGQHIWALARYFPRPANPMQWLSGLKHCMILSGIFQFRWLLSAGLHWKISGMSLGPVSGILPLFRRSILLKILRKD